jgi:DNA-binding MarR family transcriptional regulator
VKRQTTNDRRVRLVELTAKGRALVAKTFERHAAAMEKANTLSKEERVNLLQLLKKLGKGGEDMS